QHRPIHHGAAAQVLPNSRNEGAAAVMATRPRSRSIVVCALALGAFARVTTAQQIPVSAGLTLDRDTVRIGDSFRIVVSLRVPRGATIEFPTALDSSGTVQSLDPRAV